MEAMLELMPMALAREVLVLVGLLALVEVLTVKAALASAATRTDLAREALA